MSQPPAQKTKNDRFLETIVPFVLLGFTALAFLGAALSCVFLVLVMLNWSGNDSANAFVIGLQLIPTCLCIGGLFGFLSLSIRYMEQISNNSARTAEALARIVESQSRKKAS